MNARRVRVGGAAVVLALWLAGLGMLARRELLRSDADRLAEAALGVQPSAEYFTIERGGRIVGGGSSQLDTTGYGVVLRQHAFGELIEGERQQADIRAASVYSPRLAFITLHITFERGSDSVTIRARRLRDSLVVVEADGLDAPVPADTMVAPDPVFLPTVVPLQLMLTGEPKRGRIRRARIFDVLERRVREVQMRIADDSAIVVTDSAFMQPPRNRWITAHRDTVRAWKIESLGSGVWAWVDRSGRLVAASDGRGAVYRRTAYEIAYENWRIEHGRRP